MTRHKVYPRACGATMALTMMDRERYGLSPRMRGNLVGGGLGLLMQRSIPAHAGQPRFAQPCHLAFEVYPRACGATGWLARYTLSK